MKHTEDKIRYMFERQCLHDGIGDMPRTVNGRYQADDQQYMWVGYQAAWVEIGRLHEIIYEDPREERESLAEARKGMTKREVYLIKEFVFAKKSLATLGKEHDVTKARLEQILTGALRQVLNKRDYV